MYYMINNQSKLLVYSVLLLLLLFSIINCKSERRGANFNDVNLFIGKSQIDTSVNYQDMLIWRRNEDGIVFDCSDSKYRLLITRLGGERYYYFKELFPIKDSVFFPLNYTEIEIKNYPFKWTDFNSIFNLFNNTDAESIRSLDKGQLVMIIKSNFTVIYSKEKFDLGQLNKFKAYDKFNDHWIYSLN